jgi:uncharacterized membrane protein (DUF373 family)
VETDARATNENGSRAGPRPPGSPRQRRASGRRAVPHTQIHSVVRRTLENLQDVIATCLIVLLFALAVQAIWRVTRMAFSQRTTFVEAAATGQLLAGVMYVLILVELYRLLIFYLREHRVAVSLAVEVALVSTLREVMITGAPEFDNGRLFGLSLLLIVLGALLIAERWMRRWPSGAPDVENSP